MIWGVLGGAVVGVIYYIFRLGGVLIVRHAQMGLHVVLIQAILHAISPAAIGAARVWVVS